MPASFSLPPCAKTRRRLRTDVGEESQTRGETGSPMCAAPNAVGDANSNCCRVETGTTAVHDVCMDETLLILCVVKKKFPVGAIGVHVRSQCDGALCTTSFTLTSVTGTLAMKAVTHLRHVIGDDETNLRRMTQFSGKCVWIGGGRYSTFLRHPKRPGCKIVIFFP